LAGQASSQAAMSFMALAKEMPAALNASFTFLLKLLSLQQTGVRTLLAMFDYVLCGARGQVP